MWSMADWIQGMQFLGESLHQLALVSCVGNMGGTQNPLYIPPTAP